MLCTCRASHLGLLYSGSILVLLVYSILYGLTAREAPWLGVITSASVIILGMSVVLFLGWLAESLFSGRSTDNNFSVFPQIGMLEHVCMVSSSFKAE